MEATKSIGKLDAISLSNYILEKYSPMSHLKLQKLLYYCEAYHLAYFDESIIDCNFEAWAHGPVCREVFNNLKNTSLLYADITYSGDSQIANVEQRLISTQIQLLDDVLKDLSGWKDIELEKATHDELPWIEARKGIPDYARCENIISKDTMKSFYRKELNM